MTSTPAHLTYNGRPYCDHMGCMAGLSLAKAADVHSCSYPSLAAATRAKRELRRHVYAAVRVVPGDCPTAP